MGRWGLILASSALFAATSAHAQLINATGGDTSSVTLDGKGFPELSGSWVLQSKTSKSGASFEGDVQITPDYVSFESGNAVAGPNAYAVSSSSVNVYLQNTTGSFYNPTLESTIIPAGLGFYIQDRSDGCGGDLFTGCSQLASPFTFDDLVPAAGYTNGTPFARTGFNFTIMDGESTVLTLDGLLTMSMIDGEVVIDDSGLSDAAAFLNGWTHLTPGAPGTSEAYAWDATDFEVALLSAVAPYDTRTLTYTATVFSETHVNCLSQTSCLVAYSGFGDPIGRGGGIESLASFAFRGTFQALDANSGISGIVFDPVQFQPFRIADNGGPGAVPEPAAWALMLVGFGALGGALRRRRALAPA